MAAPSAEAVFDALGDPTRRRLVEALASEPATATALARDLPISRQAVAKQLALLRTSQLVEAERVGRETRYFLQPDALSEAARWAERVGGEWTASLGRLERVVSGT